MAEDSQRTARMQLHTRRRSDGVSEPGVASLIVRSVLVAVGAAALGFLLGAASGWLR